MNNVVRCDKCKRFLIQEELRSHKCESDTTEINRIIDVTYEWWMSSVLDEIGEFLLIKGADGALYRMNPLKKPQQFRTVKKGLYQPPDDSYQQDDPDDKLPEPEKITFFNYCNHYLLAENNGK